VYVSLTVLLIGSSARAAENKALLLESDPDSFFEAPDHDAFHKELGTQMTVEAWVYVKNQAGERMIVNKEDSWEFAVIDGILQSALRPAGAEWEWLSSGLLIPMEEWTHVAITWDGTNVRMYADGKEGNPGPKAGKELNATGDTFKVGRRVRGDATHSIFDGLVDEVRVSKVIRYEGDYAIPVSGFEPDDDTVALYHFDEEVGGTIKDFSKNGVHGKLMGNARLVPSEAPTLLAIEAYGSLVTLWGRLRVSY
jgi:hypothetical protein